MADLGTARGRIIIDSSGVRSGLLAGSGAIDLFSKKALGLGAGLLGGYGIVKGIKDTISASAEFEQQLSNLEAVSGASGKQLTALSDQALRLGKSSKFSASEVAGAQVELVKAGASTSDVLGGALDSVLALAAAGDVDLASSAKTVANSLNLFNLTASESSRVADILAVTANTTATDVSDLAMAFQQGGSAAKQAGLPIEDFAGLLGALAEEGVSGSDAGTSLKAALLSLIAPIGRGATAIKEYGLNFFKANGEIKGAAGIADELRDKLGKLNPQQRTAVLQAIAGRDGFRALAAAYDLGGAALERNIAASQRQGAAAETARTKQDNLRGDVEKLTGAIETLQIKAGGAAVAGLRGLTQGVTGAIDAASDSENLAAFGNALVDLAGAGADAITSLQPLGEAIVTVAGSTLGVVGSVAGFGAAALGAASDAGILQAALIGLAAGYATVKVASLAAAASTRLVAGAQTIGAFTSLASSVRSGSGALSLLAAAAPRASALLTNPYVLAGAAVAGVTAGVVLLATGAFQGASAAEQLASSVASITTAATAAQGAVTGLNGAVSGLRDANLRATETALAVKRAEVDLATARQAHGRNSLEAAEAEARLGRARFNANLAIREQAVANRTLTASTANAVVKGAELITQIRRGVTSQEAQVQAARRFGGVIGANSRTTQEFTSALRQIDRAGGSVGDRFNALRTFIRRASAEIDTGTRSGKQAKATLDQLGRLDTAGISHFGTTFNNALKSGAKPAEALKTALRDIKPPKSIKLDAEDRATGKARKVVGETKKIKDKKFTINAETSSAIASLSSVKSLIDGIHDKSVTLTVNKVDKKGSWNTEEMIRNLRREPAKRRFSIEFAPEGTGKAQTAIRARTSDAILADREALDSKLARIDAREDARQQAAEKRRLRRSLSNARAELGRAKDSSERSDALRAISDAKAALREFAIVGRVEARRAAVGIRTSLIDGVNESRGAMQSALQDIGAKLGEAIDRGLQVTLGQIEDTLKSRIEGIDRDLRDTLAAIAASPEAARVAAIDLDLASSRDARDARDAARQRAELGKATLTADQLVARRREILARARTESERQAAAALLAQALADQATAATAQADFEEEQRLTALEREKAGLEASLQARRDAAQRARDETAAEFERIATVEREAAQARADEQKANLERQLGDLANFHVRNEKERRQFNKRLAAIVGDPDLARDLERSGRELGLAFTRGLERSILDASDAAERLAKSIAKYLKLRSPAETGPLAFDFSRSGFALGRDMAAGLLRSRATAERAAAGVAGALATRAALAGTAAAAAGGDGGFSQFNTFNVEGPTLDPRSLSAQMAFERQHGGRR